MAIGTLAAVALGAGALGSAAISSSASGKAANAATDAANQSAAVQREQLTAAQNALSPYNVQNQGATGAINQFLGIGDQTDWAGLVNSNPSIYKAWLQDPQGLSAADYGKAYYQNDLTYHQGGHVGVDGQLASDANPNYQGLDLTQYQNGGQAGLDRFRQSTGYQDTMNEALRGVNSGYAGIGAVQSGAAMKGIASKAGQIAMDSQGAYLNALGNQQSVGLSAGSALAGVGQNYANSLGTINSNRADAVGNSALLNAANTNSLISGLTSGIFKYGMK